MSAAASFDSFKQELDRLVEVFGRNLAAYESAAARLDGQVERDKAGRPV